MVQGGGSRPFAVIALVDAMDKHRGAFEYDWRARFNLPLTCIPEDMDWGEAHRLYEILSNDPSSQVCAAQVEWNYPLSRSEIVGIHQYDMINGALQGNKAKPYPKPWPDDEKKVYKSRKRRSDADIRNRLQKRREGQELN